MVSVCPLTQDAEDGSENADEPEIGRALASTAIRPPKRLALAGAAANSIVTAMSNATAAAVDVRIVSSMPRAATAGYADVKSEPKLR
jgi:hypothetical protein